jgi:hypothetical protein
MEQLSRITERALKANQPNKQSSKQLCNLPKRAIKVKEYFPEVAKFANEFNLDSCTEKYLKFKTQDDALRSGMVKLSELCKAYNDKSITAWIQAWLINLAKYMDFSVTPEQVKSTAIAILEECYMLNLAEFTLLFRRILKGYYGIFYGKFNGQMIIGACISFRQERGKILAKMSTEEQKKII